MYFVGFLLVTVAWWTTNIGEQRHVRTVFLLERRRSRTQRRLTNHTEAVTITDGTYCFLFFAFLLFVRLRNIIPIICLIRYRSFTTCEWRNCCWSIDIRGFLHHWKSTRSCCNNFYSMWYWREFKRRRKYYWING